jgi:hypothetical protein
MTDRCHAEDFYRDSDEAAAYRAVRDLAESIFDVFYGPSGLDVPKKTAKVLETAYRTLKTTSKYYQQEQPILDLWNPLPPGSPFRKNPRAK